MPLFEYACEACGHRFEWLARGPSDKPGKCPACGSKKVGKQFSTFAAPGESGGGFSCADGSCSTGSCSTGSCPTGTCPFG